ncbi:MAG: acyl-CoA thioesterase [Planctomycetota bacterium]
MNQFRHSEDSILSPIAKFEFPREVRLVDTDSTGFAHFSSYVRMMEEAEYAFLRSRGLGVVLRDQKGTMGFPRLKAEIHIERPLVYQEKVIVRLDLIGNDGKSLEYDFEIVDETNETAVTGSFQAACCRFPDGELPFAILIPENVCDKLNSKEANVQV